MTNVLDRPSTRTSSQFAELAVLVAEAGRTVPPLWPLDTAIAVNPLAGLEQLPFEEALREGAELFGARPSMSLGQWRRLVSEGRVSLGAVRKAAVDALGGWETAFAMTGANHSPFDCLLARLLELPLGETRQEPADEAALLVAKWCAAFFDRGVAARALPGRHEGLYRAIAALLPHDPDFRRLVREKPSAADLASEPLEAIDRELRLLGTADEGRLGQLRRLIARLPGWAGHIRWRTEHSDEASDAPAGIADLLALLLLVDRATGLRPTRPAALADPNATMRALGEHFHVDPATLHPQVREIAAMDEAELGLIFQRAAERSYRDALVARLPTRAPVAKSAPKAQLVFCIDVRSEPFRRALEREGDYETFGYAGFFGLPIATHAPHQPRARRLPVLVQPQHEVALVPEPGSEGSLLAERGAAARRDLLQLAKNGAATGFATAEAMGPLAGLAMVANGAAPRKTARLRQRSEPRLQPQAGPCGEIAGLTLDERVAYARALFALTGMSRDTAPLVVLLGHRGQAVNNPYAAALDCGACGGHAGRYNAQLLANILNDPEVRAALAKDGQAIPSSTLFVAGEHCTTTDEVSLPEVSSLPESHRAPMRQLASALQRAGDVNRSQRSEALGLSVDDLPVGAAHWGEVRPEWGLAGAASFIVGPRWLTRDVDLEGRTFLHSYDWQTDPEGEALETILTAPMVVAQWITCQYLFSTLDPDRYGAGDKTVHNPVGRIGVVRGNGGDLCVGLPRQSIFRDDGAPFHVPQRLLTVVQAPLHRVEAVVERHAILRRLFNNGWVQLVVMDPATGRFRRWAEDRELATLAPARAPEKAPQEAAGEVA